MFRKDLPGLSKLNQVKTAWAFCSSLGASSDRDNRQGSAIVNLRGMEVAMHRQIELPFYSFEEHLNAVALMGDCEVGQRFPQSSGIVLEMCSVNALPSF